MSRPRTFFFALAVSSCLFASQARTEDKDPFAALNVRRDQVIEQLNKSMKCDSLSELYCHTEFRGLKVEFAGVNSPSGGTLYVHSIGSNQTVSPFGNRCLEVEFSDKDLAQGIIPVQVIFRNDAKIFSNERLLNDSKGCS